MEHASAGMRVIRPAASPVAAAQAERARNRLERIASDQRGLDAQKATIEYGESTLRETMDALQIFRALMVNAGSSVYDQVQRDALVEQLTSLRERIAKYANRVDSNGLPLFRGLDAENRPALPNDGRASIGPAQQWRVSHCQFAQWRTGVFQWQNRQRRAGG